MHPRHAINYPLLATSPHGLLGPNLVMVSLGRVKRKNCSVIIGCYFMMWANKVNESEFRDHGDPS